MAHLASFVVILTKIYGAKNCHGISLKSQMLYVLVFVCRYTDMFWSFYSVYNEMMKIIFILASIAIVYMMKFVSPYKNTYDHQHDVLPIVYLIVPCFVIALIFNEEFTPFEIIWAFSIYLEAVAIVPQIWLMNTLARQSDGHVENLTAHYVFLLGSYRALYLVNWVWRFFTEDNYRNWIVWIAGALQTAIYSDFLYYYIKARPWEANAHMSLPL